MKKVNKLTIILSIGASLTNILIAQSSTSFIEVKEKILYEAPDRRKGSVISVIKDGWLNIYRCLPNGEKVWDIMLAQATDSSLPEVTFKARDDGSHYPAYAVITYKNGFYFIKDDGYVIRCRRQMKDKNHSLWLQPPPVSDYNQLCIAGYGSNDLMGWTSKSRLIIGTGGPNDLSDCLINLTCLEPDEEIMWQAEATKMGVRSFSYKGGEAFLHDDGELLIAKYIGETFLTSRNKTDRKLSVGLPIPEFKFKKVLIPNKNDLSVEEYRDKVLLLDFWGMWCGPCVKNVPKLQELYDTYKDKGLVVIGIHSSHNYDKLEEFIKKHNITYPIAIASEGMQKTYKITSWPTYILVDKRGNVISANTNTLPTKTQLDKIINESASKEKIELDKKK